MSGLQFPMTVSSIYKFEKLNEISINVFAYEKEVFSLHIAKQRNTRHVNLLLKKDGLHHYCFIKKLNGLLYNLTKHKGRMYFCRHCLQRFSFQSGLENHVECCKEHNTEGDFPR